MNCPYCNSTNTVFLEKQNKWLCNNEDCNRAFTAESNNELTTNSLRVFVSYGHDDYSPFAKELNRSLKRRGHKTFLDGEWLHEGKDWEMQLEKGLDFIAEDPENGRILLVITPYSVRRPDGYCLNEIAKALDKRMTIIPVMLVWAEMPLSIYRLQYLDLKKSADKDTITANFEADFAEICRVIETKDLLDTTGSMSSLKSALDPLDFSADLTLHQPWFTGREWVFDEIRSWLNDEKASRLFWITGVPGIGKTTIATHLLQRFKNIVAFHLCRRGHSEKASPKRIVCSLAYQLSTQIKSYREILSTMSIKEEVERANAAALFDMLIVQPLHKVASPYDYPLVILIDGLDEASHDGQNEVAQFLAAEFDKLPKWLRIILTSRPEQEIITPLKSKSEPWVLDPEYAQNEQDIIDYLNKRLEKYNNREDYNKIITTLSANASGVFQYAKCVCDEIDEGRYNFNDLEELPKNLAGIYQQYFANKFKNEDYYNEKVRPALEVLIATFDPITKDELKLFIGWDDYAVRKFLKDIGSYITVNSDNKLVVSHASLFDWLEDETLSGDYWVDKDRGAKGIYNYQIIIWNAMLESYSGFPSSGSDYQEFDSKYEYFRYRSIDSWMQDIYKYLTRKEEYNAAIKNLHAFYSAKYSFDHFNYIELIDFDKLDKDDLDLLKEAITTRAGRYMSVLSAGSESCANTGAQFLVELFAQATSLSRSSSCVNFMVDIYANKFPLLYKLFQSFYSFDYGIDYDLEEMSDHCKLLLESKVVTSTESIGWLELLVTYHPKTSPHYKRNKLK